MRFGISVPNFRGPASLETFNHVARRGEEAGFDDIWIGDHIVMPKKTDVEHPYFGTNQWGSDYRPGNWSGDIPVYEPFTLMGYLAGITERVGIGIGTLVVPIRNPVETAKMLATVDVLSGGRIILGVGVGWLKEEFAALGVPWEQRGRRTDEYLALMQELWRNPEPEFSGQFYDLPDGIWFEPRPAAGSIPIWVGGNSPAALRRAARIGDGWYGVDVDPSGVRTIKDKLTHLMDQNDRDSSGFICSVRVDVEIKDRPGVKPADGPAEKVAEAIREYEAAGLTHFQMSTSPRLSTDGILEQIDRFCEQVEPLLE